MKTVFVALLFTAARLSAQPEATPSPAQGQAAVPASMAGNAQCLSCHEPISTLLKKKVVHQALEGGCTACHIDHKAATAASDARAQATHYVVSGQPALCANCHDLKGTAIVAAHRGKPFDKANCTGCHNPHGSDNAKLIASHQHPPFTSRQCETCHQNTQDGKVRFNAGSVSELCLGCHVQFRDRFDKSNIKHTFLASDSNSCTTCHRPHASEQPHLLKARVVSLCTSCHVDKPGNKKFVHDPARENCAICHDPHSSNFPVHLKADVNTLCTSCHGVKPPTRNSEGELLAMPAEFRDRSTKIFLDAHNTGHPYVGHPVSGVFPVSAVSKDAASAPAETKLLSCISCHTPHSGNVVQRFVGELRGNALCLSCHGKK